MSTMGLTPRMQATYNAIRSHIAAHGVSPTYTDLCEALGTKSRGLIHRRIQALRERGYVTWQYGRRQSIALTNGQPSYTLPAHVQRDLERYCAERGERVSDVLADAVTLFLDGSLP